MEQPVENRNVENMNTVPETQKVRANKEAMKMVLERARDHYDETYPCLEKVIEECSKKIITLTFCYINGNHIGCTIYLNKLGLTDNVDDNDSENLRCIPRILVLEFEDYNLPKLIGVLCIVDNLIVNLTVSKLQDILIKTDTIREISFFFNCS